MPNLSVHWNGLEYTGYFVRPLFGLWASGSDFLAGMYDALRPLGISLTSMRTANAGASLGDQGFVATIGNKELELRPERIRVSISSFATAELATFADVLQRMHLWLGSSGSVEIDGEQLTYAAQCKLEDGAAAGEYLASLAPAVEWDAATAQPSGRIFHYTMQNPLAGAEIQLTVDRSATIDGGLFLYLLLTTHTAAEDYLVFMRDAQEILRRLTARLDLTFDETRTA